MWDWVEERTLMTRWVGRFERGLWGWLGWVLEVGEGVGVLGEEEEEDWYGG